MDLRATFEHRSGRVIAALRCALAFVFLVALIFEPAIFNEGLRQGVILLGSYLLMSLVLVAVAWRSWWLDQRLALPVLLVDVAAFIGSVFVTEGYDADFTSPFLAMFALIVLSATLRLGSASAARTGVVVSLLFILLGLVLVSAGFPIEIYRFSRRAFYMVALLPVLVWFGIDRRGPEIPPLEPPPDIGQDRLCGAALAYAMKATGATHGILAWSESDEPWIELYQSGGSGTDQQRRVGPDELPGWDEIGDRPRLFDLRRRRILVLDCSGRAKAVRSDGPLPLASLSGIAEGLVLPLASTAHTGQIVLGGIRGPGADFLALGQAIAREIEMAADRATATRLERERAVMRERGAIARDLHDSVAQSLAGACFRLEALRRTVSDSASTTPAEEIAAVRDALRGEQAQVRGLIEALRVPQGLSTRPPLADDLQRTIADAAAHWNITASLSTEVPITIPGRLNHELRQLLREAVANAVRHGHATGVIASLSPAAGGVDLVVSDNGMGFASVAGDTPPWSISERVSTLGGRLEVRTGPDGTRLAIFLPLAASLEQPK